MPIPTNTAARLARAFNAEALETQTETLARFNRVFGTRFTSWREIEPDALIYLAALLTDERYDHAKPNHLDA